MAESFYSALKNVRVHRTVYAAKPQARSVVIRYIEGYYSSRRRHSALGYRRPNEVYYWVQQPALAALKNPLIPLSEITAAAQYLPSGPSGESKYGLLVTPIGADHSLNGTGMA